MNNITDINITIQEPKGGENHMNKKAVIYCRVASDGQAQSFPLEKQKEVCTRFAQSKGYKVVDVVSEQGSGLRINHQLQKLIKSMKAGRIKTIIVSSIDRLGRDFSLVNTTIKDVEDNNGEVRCANEPDSSPEANLLRDCSLAFTDYYRRQHSERIKRGLAARKQRLAEVQSK